MSSIAHSGAIFPETSLQLVRHRVTRKSGLPSQHLLHQSPTRRLVFLTPKMKWNRYVGKFILLAFVPSSERQIFDLRLCRDWKRPLLSLFFKVCSTAFLAPEDTTYYTQQMNMCNVYFCSKRSSFPLIQLALSCVRSFLLCRAGRMLEIIRKPP